MTGLLLVLWIAGVVLWNAVRSKAHPLEGAWERLDYSASPLRWITMMRVNADGTFQRYQADGAVGITGTCKPVEAYARVGWRPEMILENSGPFGNDYAAPYFTKAKVDSRKDLQWDRDHGKLSHCENAYLFKYRFNEGYPDEEQLIVLIKNGQILHGVESHWTFRRPPFWPDWLTNWMEQIKSRFRHDGASGTP